MFLEVCRGSTGRAVRVKVGRRTRTRVPACVKGDEDLRGGTWVCVGTMPLAQVIHRRIVAAGIVKDALGVI
jgi:hypothetical protein